MKAVALYEMAPDMMSQVPAHMSAHRERWQHPTDVDGADRIVTGAVQPATDPSRVDRLVW